MVIITKTSIRNMNTCAPYAYGNYATPMHLEYTGVATYYILNYQSQL